MFLKQTQPNPRLAYRAGHSIMTIMHPRYHRLPETTWFVQDVVFLFSNNALRRKRRPLDFPGFVSGGRATGRAENSQEGPHKNPHRDSPRRAVRSDNPKRGWGGR